MAFLLVDDKSCFVAGKWNWAFRLVHLLLFLGMMGIRINKLTAFLPHVFFWLVILSFPFYLHPDTLASGSFDGVMVLFFLLRFLLWVTFFYVNAYFLIPRLVYLKKYGFYIIAQLLVVSLLYLFHFIFSSLFHDRNYNHAFILTVFPYVFIILTSSTFYQMIRNKNAMDKAAGEREQEYLRTELSFLRSQVNPHFMFNVLNNLVSLARKKSDLLEPSLIKFASLLRYMIYETGEEKKYLENEIEYLQNYIDLQQQRFGASIQVQASFQKDNLGYLIEPMLLIPFVENAFKHSVTGTQDATIEISLSVVAGTLYFIVRNRFQEPGTGFKDAGSGIGLQNVKRRLELLYQQKHQLDIMAGNGWFTVSLQLNLQV